MPTFDEAEKHAMTVLLSLVVQAQDERAAAEKAKEEAAERVKTATRNLTARRAAFAAFGFDISAEKFWETVRAAMGEVSWQRAFARAKEIAQTKETPPKDNTVLVVLPTPEAASTTEPPADTSEDDEQGMDTDSASIREIVLTQLDAAGEAGRKAADIRAFVESAHHRTIHEKTIGMTLYRLSKEGAVRREGRTWFLVPPSVETRNPGASTPGSAASVFDE